jgi:hypothetical protein
MTGLTVFCLIDIFGVCGRKIVAYEKKNKLRKTPLSGITKINKLKGCENTTKRRKNITRHVGGCNISA